MKGERERLEKEYVELCI
jgi:hypothetical protein